MGETQTNRRHFIKNATNSVGGIAILSALPKEILASAGEYASSRKPAFHQGVPRIKFSVIGINHGHIHSQIETVIRGGGQVVSFCAKEADLAADFAKRYPQARLARS